MPLPIPLPIIGAALGGVALSDMPIVGDLLGSGGGGGNQGGGFGAIELLVLGAVAVGGILGLAMVMED